MIITLIVFIINFAAVRGAPKSEFGILEAGDHKDFIVNSGYATQIALLSFQGPIKFAIINKDGSLTDIEPIPGSYFFYDYLYPQNYTSLERTYRVYGSAGGATFPQYKLNMQYSDNLPDPRDIQPYQNQSIKFTQEDGYLIIDVPMMLKKNGEFISSSSYYFVDSFLIFYGDKSKEQQLKLLANQYEDSAIWSSCEENEYAVVSYSNFITRIYHKLNPQNNINYFAVTTYYNLPLGGYAFEPVFPQNDSKTWIWITITIIVVIIGLGLLIVKIRRSKQSQEEDRKQEQSFQEYH